jgi:hypothetical protein
MIGCLLFPLILAFAYRSRGGAIPLGSDTLARLLFWALPISFVSGGVCYFQHLPLWLALPCAIAAFGGATIPHAGEQGNTIEQNEGMSIITTAMLALILLPFVLYTVYSHSPFLGVTLFALPFGLLGGHRSGV